MAGKSDTIFGPASLATVPPPGAGSLVSSGASRSLARREKALVEELRIQALAIQAAQRKAAVAQAAISQLHVQAEAVFDYTAGAVLAIKDRPGRSKEHQAYLNEFTTRNLQMAGNHMIGVVAVTAHNIAEITSMPLYQPPEPEPRGLRRLFG